MGWQAPRYIYPQPDTPQYGQALISGLKEGAMMGVSMGGKIKEAANKKGLQNDVTEINAAADKKLESLKTPEAIPATGTTVPATTTPVASVPVETAPVAIQAAPTTATTTNVTAPQIGGDKALAMANMAPAQPAPAAPLPDDIKIKRIEIEADRHKQLIKAHSNHGFHREARDMEDKYKDQVIKLAGLDYKAAQRVWNSTEFLTNKNGTVNFTPKPKVTIHGSGGNFVAFNETTGETTQINSFGELKSIDPDKDVYMKAPGEDGKPTWIKVQFGKPKAPGDGLRKYDDKGEEITEVFENGEWRPKGKSPKWKDGDGKDAGSAKDGKTAQKHLDDWFVQKYAGDMVEETGKAPDKNTVLAKNGNKAVEGKMINGKPVPLQELHDAMQAYYERQIEGGAKPAEALNNTLQFGQQYGSTKKETDFSKVTPAQYEQAGVDKATVSKINAKIAEYKKKGVNLKDVRINKKGGYIEYVPDKGEVERVLISKPAAKAAAKSTTPAKTAEKPTEKPAEKPATTPAAQPAAKAAAAQKSTVSDLEKKTGIGGTDDKQIAEATRKKRIEKLTKEIDQKSIDAQVEEVASYQSRRFGVPIGFARKRARALIEKEIAAKKTELASLQK